MATNNLRSIEKIVDDAKNGDIVRIVLKEREVCGYLRFVSQWIPGVYKIFIDGPCSDGSLDTRDEYMPRYTSRPYGTYGNASLSFTLAHEISSEEYRCVEWKKKIEETKNILGYQILLRR